MPTVLLLMLWTAWLLVALLLLGSWYGMTAALAFVTLGITFWAKTDMTWRSYLMATAIAYVPVAVTLAIAGWRRLRLSVATVVSLLGLLWLWLDGGAAYWPYVVGIPLGGGAVAGPAYLYLWYRKSHPALVRKLVPPPLPEPHGGHDVRPPPSPLPFDPVPPVFSGSRERTIPDRSELLNQPERPEDQEEPEEPAGTPLRLYPQLSGSGWVPRGGGGAGIRFETRPDAGQIRRVTPRIRPAACLNEAAGETVRVSGLARFFPAGTAHGWRSATAAPQEPCELTDTDHLHIHRVSAPLAPLLNPGSPARDALVALLGRGDDPSAIAEFQRTLAALHQPGEPAPTIEITRLVVVTDGPPSGPAAAVEYIAEDTILSVPDLLAENAGLVRLLIQACTAPGGGPAISGCPATSSGPATPDGPTERAAPDMTDCAEADPPSDPYARLLHGLLKAGHRDAETALLPPADAAPDGTNAAIFGLFCSATVHSDRAVFYHPAGANLEDWAVLTAATRPGGTQV
jgi:hypothetical protein